MTTSGKNMNCEDYKKAIAADPAGLTDSVAEHVAACEVCAGFAGEMRSLNDRIAAALAIDVPGFAMPELPEIVDDNVVNLPFRGKQRVSTPVWIGIAAGFALAAIIAVRMTGDYQGAGLSLADEVLAHLDHEPGSLVVTNVAVSEERFSQVVNPSVGTMDRSVGLVTYAQSCEINGRTIPHLVIQGEKGPITLLLMPDEMIDTVTILQGEGVGGVILPVGKGSIAIIGERDEPLEGVRKRVIDSVEWSI